MHWRSACGIVPIRSWTRTLRPLRSQTSTKAYHTIPYRFPMQTTSCTCLMSCLSVRTQPLTATGAPSQTSTIPYHTIPYHTIPYHTGIPYHTIPYHTIPFSYRLASISHQRPRLVFKRSHTIPSPRFTGGIYQEAGLFLMTPFTEGCGGVNYQTLPPGRSNMLYF